MKAILHLPTTVADERRASANATRTMLRPARSWTAQTTAAANGDAAPPLVEWKARRKRGLALAQTNDEARHALP